MPPRKNAAAPSATGTAKLSTADFFKPAKPSTSLRTTPFKNSNQKSHPVIVQPEVDRRPLSDLTAATPATRKHPAPDTDKEDDDFGDDLDLDGVLSDDDHFFCDLKDRSEKDKSSSFKDSGSIAKADLKTGSKSTIRRDALAGDLNQLFISILTLFCPAFNSLSRRHERDATSSV